MDLLKWSPMVVFRMGGPIFGRAIDLAERAALCSNLGVRQDHTITKHNCIRVLSLRVIANGAGRILTVHFHVRLRQVPCLSASLRCARCELCVARVH